MIEFHKQADGSWKRFGQPLSSEERVRINFGNSGDAGLSVLMGSNLEGEYSFGEAIEIVEGLIRQGKVRDNTILIESSEWHHIQNVFDDAKRDLIARHQASASVPKGFHDYSIDVYRGTSDKPIMRRVGSLELVQLIKDRLRQRFSGRICDPAGSVLDEWMAE